MTAAAEQGRQRHDSMTQLAVRLSDDMALPVDLPWRARQAIREEAAFQGVSPERLVADMLTRIADRNLFARVFDMEEDA